MLLCVCSVIDHRSSKCGKNKKVANGEQPSLSLLFVPPFDVFCDLLLFRHMATEKLFVSNDKKKQNVKGDIIYASVLQQIINKKQSKCIYNSLYHIIPIR